MMNQILIVEDDTNINNLLKEALEQSGYTCQQAFSGTEARMLLNMNSYGMVMLDLMLPGMPGEEVLQEIRATGDTPVIILTAKDELDDKIKLLTSGADDYITKPFQIKEVLARVQVQLRRNSKNADIEAEILKEDGQEDNSQKDEVLECQGLRVCKKNFEVNVEGTNIPNITKREFAILELLLKHPKQVFSKEDIFEYAWDEPYMGETKTLDVHVSNIRKKLKTVTEREYIETVWGIGYRLHLER